MSMENAILELAAGMKELAAAVREARGGWSPVVLAESAQRIKGVMSGVQGTTAEDAAADFIPGRKNKYGSDLPTEDPVEIKAAELAAATEQRATAAREAQEKDAAANAAVKKQESAPMEEKPSEEAKPESRAAGPVSSDAELEAAVTKVEEAAQGKSAERQAMEEVIAANKAAAEAAPLDYAKGVKPVLLNLVKAKGKPALVDLLAKYKAKNGEQIKADDFAAIVADANALIAG